MAEREREDGIAVAEGHDAPSGKRKVYSQLWFWVLIAIVLGIAFGLLFEKEAVKAQWLAEAFIQLIKAVTGPVIFVTVVIGVASLGDMARAGGLAVRALGYFLAATIVALALGLLAANIVKPGAGLDAAASEVGRADAQEQIDEAGGSSGLVGFITDDLLPSSFVEPFVENEILRVLVLALLTAAAISGLAVAHRERIVGAFQLASQVIFRIIRMIMWWRRSARSAAWPSPWPSSAAPRWRASPC